MQLYAPSAASKPDHARWPCGCGFPVELGAKVKTTKISSGVSGGIFAISQGQGHAQVRLA